MGFRSPLQIRRLNGALNRVPTNLYDRVWKVLERVKGGVSIAGNHLPQASIGTDLYACMKVNISHVQEPTLSVMTQQELNFSYKIESMMRNIAHPEYRQILVELLCIIATIMERNPEIYFVEALDCDSVRTRASCLSVLLSCHFSSSKRPSSCSARSEG